MTTINIDLDKKCHECGKGGATNSCVCLGCIAKIIGGKAPKSAAGAAVKDRLANARRSRSP